MSDVVRMDGLVNGSTVILTKGSGGGWSVAVPSNISGEYVIELHAYDQAGNVAYSTKYLFVVDTASLRVVLRPLNYTAEAYDKFGVELPAPTFAYYWGIGSVYEAKQRPLNYSVGKVKIA